MAQGKKCTIDDYRGIAIGRGVRWIGKTMPKNTSTSTQWHCLRCGHLWSTSYTNIKNGAGCRECVIEFRRIPEQAYIDYACQNGFRYIGGYRGNVLVDVKWECSQGHRWEACFSSVKNAGTRCPYCDFSRKKTEDEYKALALGKGLEYIGGYAGNVKDKVEWRCSQGHVFQTSYDQLSGHVHGCSLCATNRQKGEAEYHELAVERGYAYLGGYSGNVRKNVSWQCGAGHVWSARYDNIRQGKGCPLCLDSRSVEKIAELLKSMQIPFEREKRFESCRLQRPLPFDFYFQVEEVELLCEFDGHQHFLPIKSWGGQKVLSETQRRDRIKSAWATKNGYRLIRVPYTVEDVQEYVRAAIHNVLDTPALVEETE